MTPTAEQALEALDNLHAEAHSQVASSLVFGFVATIRQHIEATAAEVEALRKDAALVCAYQLPHCKVEVAKQKDGSTLWAVRTFGDCLNKRGEWEYEPLPSSRDAEFIQRCRFATARDAIDAALNQGGK